MRWLPVPVHKPEVGCTLCSEPSVLGPTGHAVGM